MKIVVKIWDENGKVCMTSDPQYQNRDTPKVQHYGGLLLKALEGCGVAE